MKGLIVKNMIHILQTLTMTRQITINIYTGAYMLNKGISKISLIVFPFLTLGCTQGQGIHSFPSPTKGEPIQSYFAKLVNADSVERRNDLGTENVEIYQAENLKHNLNGIAAYAGAVWTARFNSSIKDYCLLNGMKTIKTTDEFIAVDRGVRCTGDTEEIYSYVSSGIQNISIIVGIKGTDEMLGYIAKYGGGATLSPAELQQATKYNNLIARSKERDKKYNEWLAGQNFLKKRYAEYRSLLASKTLEGSTMCKDIGGNLTEYAIVTQKYNNDRLKIDITQLLRRSNTTRNTAGFAPYTDVIALNRDQQWFFCEKLN
ncbi:hypothetical protein [Citrobacter sp. JGM124]|uniref:hypothetical protein n=1 Tax=Citrobacter sp. JGM124 TaxID=2799789 RepID=UPI001BA7B642|nr:hypothetical protein [Citrobacter sp. JGM124]MBS0848356.1 hypothetical protein [Citrobacter sp. JGM124]